MPRRFSLRIMRLPACSVVLLLLFSLLSLPLSESKKGHPKERQHGNGSSTHYITFTRHRHPHIATPTASQAARLSSFSSSHELLSARLSQQRQQQPTASSSQSASQPLTRTLHIDRSQFSSLSGRNVSSSETAGEVLRLTDSYHVMYTARVSIGTPLQSFNMILDTGSSCLWAISASPQPPQQEGAAAAASSSHSSPSSPSLPSSASSSLSSPHSRYLHYYDHSLSSTYEADNSPWDIQYGVGQCTGFLSRDTVSLSPALTVSNQTLAEAVSLSSNFLNPQQPLDGIVGMSYRGGACRQYSTLIERLREERRIRRKVFSFHLDRREGEGEVNEVVIGEEEGDGRDGERIVYTDVLHAPHRAPAMWFVHLEALAVVYPKGASPAHLGNISQHSQHSRTPQHKDREAQHRERDRHSARPADDDASLPADGDGEDDVMRTRERREASARLREYLAAHHADATVSTVATDTLVFCGPSTGPCIALPDTGTSFLTLPTRLFILVISLITHNRDDCLIDSLSNVFCLADPRSLPSLAFQFSSHSFLLRPAEYLLPNHQLAIQVLDFGVQDVNIVILGDVFLRSTRVVFDEEEWRVGFVRQTGERDEEGGEGGGDGSSDWLGVQPRDGVIRVSLIGLLVFASVLLCVSLLCCFVCWEWCGRRRQQAEYQPIASAA